MDCIAFGSSDGTIELTGTDDAHYINPLAFNGVSVAQSKDKFVVTNNGGDSITVRVIGASLPVKIYSQAPVGIILDNASIAATASSAVNLQTAAAATLWIEGESTVADSKKYTTADGEDENATIFSASPLTVRSSGSVAVTARKKHGICSKGGAVSIAGGSVTVVSASSDGIHSAGFVMTDGSYTCLSAGGDAIDADTESISITGGTLNLTVATADTKGLKADGSIAIGGDAAIALTLSGDQTKGIKAKGDIVIADGCSIECSATGNAVLADAASGTGYDPSYCTVVKADGAVTISGGTITINHSGKGGKGISSDGNILVSGGTITIDCTGQAVTYTNSDGNNDTYFATCITGDSDVELLGGTLTLTNSGNAGKCIKADGSMTIGNTEGGPQISAKTTGAKVKESSGTSSGGGWGPPGGGGGWDGNADYANPKAIKAGGNLTVNGGDITISTSQDGGEGLESKKTLTINGGTIDAVCYDDCINATTNITINGGYTHCRSTGNDGIDSNGTLTVTGGVTISIGTRSPEEGFDCDQNTFKITGGLLLGFGGATSSPTASACTQRSTIVGTSVNRNTAVTVVNPAGTVVASFVNPQPSGTWTLLVSSPDIVNGTHTVYTGGTVSGGEKYWETTFGGTLSGGSKVKTFNSTSMVTNSGGSTGPGGGRP